MSYALSVYLVALDDIQGLPGGVSSRLARKLIRNAKARLNELDEEMLDEDDEDDMSHQQAFRELISGDITAEYHGGRYGWAFDVLCDCLGQFMSNRGFSPVNIQWYEDLDKLLESSGIAIRFWDLIADCPIKIPLSDDWPMIGHWTHQQMTQSLEPMKKLAQRELDEEQAEALNTATEWMTAALKNPKLMIVGFHG